MIVIAVQCVQFEKGYSAVSKKKFKLKIPVRKVPNYKNAAHNDIQYIQYVF